MRIILPKTSLWFVLASLSVVGCAALMATTTNHRKKRRDTYFDGGTSHVNVSFLGNSMLYFNDTPRLLQQMIEVTVGSVTQNSCLRGGASLSSLWEKGNGMTKKFATEQALQQGGDIDRPFYDVGANSVEELLKQRSWDFVVLNDYTQAPARGQSAAESCKILSSNYRKLLQGSTCVFVQTPAYRKPGMRDTEDLGSFDEFTDRLAAGLQSYLEQIPNARIAPVGEAYRWLHHNDPTTFRKLYSWDDFHPSPYGTWLQACVIYCTCFGAPPPVYNALWWERSRYMQPPEEKPLPLPTEAEARELRRVACMVCGINNELLCYTADPMR